MVGTCIMAGIETGQIYKFTYPFSHPFNKVRDSSYPYSYPVNARIFVKMGTCSDNAHGNRFIFTPNFV